MPLNRTVFCPMDSDESPNGICGTAMRKVKVDTNAHTRDRKGKLINVTRVFYGCGRCGTIVHFEYRQDGAKGDLYLDLDFERRHGMKLLKDEKGNIIGTKPK